MRTTLLTLLLTSALMAEQPVTSGTEPVPTRELMQALQSKVALLEAQLVAAKATRLADMAYCWTTDINAVQTKYDAAVAQSAAQKLEAEQKAAQEAEIKAEAAKSKPAEVAK